MTSLPAVETQEAVAAYWQGEYARHLGARLERSLAYLRGMPPADVHTHLRSFLALLDEARRYPALTAGALQLISALHPLPLRWGMGNHWEPVLRFALEHTPREQTARRAEYRCALADMYLFSGWFDRAIAQAESVLDAPDAPDALVARAAYLIFLNLRATGRGQEAARRIEPLLERFGAFQSAECLPAERVEAWLTINQCQLELLRMRGETERALALAGEMVALAERTGSPNKIMYAELLVHRSTLLWVRARYEESVTDILAAIAIYEGEEDQFNAKSLLSNLGLVYWTMGRLDAAETTLQAALAYYRQTGFEQLLVYDLGNLGLTFFARGDIDEAIRLTDGQIELANRLNFYTESVRGQWNRAIMRYCQGSPAELKAVYDATLDYYEQSANRETFYAHFIWMAYYQEKMGEHDAALRLAREAVRQGRERGLLLLEQIALRCLASLAPAEEREPLLERALELAMRLGRRLEIAAVWLEMAGAGSAPQSRRQAWQNGVEILREIGAERWLEGHSIENPPFIPPFN